MKLNQLKKEIREANPKDEVCDIDTLCKYKYMRKSKDKNRDAQNSLNILVCSEKFHRMIFELIRANETVTETNINHKIITMQQLQEYFDKDKKKIYKTYRKYGKNIRGKYGQVK